MKKRLALFLALLMMLTCVMSVASADYYKQHQSNEATFETLEEARVNGPEWMMKEYPHRKYIADPALDEYPVGTTYVYRSPGMYCDTTGAVRMNTNLLVYTDKVFASKDEAFTYIKDLGLTAMADEATGSVVLVTPANGKAFAIADQYAYYLLQSVMCNIGFSTRMDGASYTHMDPGYYGGLTNRYLIGIDGGATFINNFIATDLDYISRIGGLLLIGGEMEKIQNVAACVPTWMVNPGEFMVDRYAVANGADSYGRNGDDEVYYNSKHPLQQVIVTRTENVDMAAAINAAYYEMFTEAMRIPVVKANLNTASTKYSNYRWNQAPYSLSDRNYIIDGRTRDGIVIIERQEERFSHIQSSSGEYVTTWYELMPEEVLDGSADLESIPLIVCNHGGGDDPIQAVDELGFLELIGKKRVAIVAMRHTSENPSAGFGSASPFDTMSDLLPALTEYMLETYPQLDPERVYVTGYSMGGSCTNRAVYGDASKFAAAVNMSGTPYNHLEGQDAQFAEIDIPMMLTTCTYDTATHFDSVNGYIAPDFEMNINDYLSYNEMPTVPAFDYETYPLAGFKADVYRETMVNDEYPLYSWFFLNDEGAPMVGLTIIEFIPHGLYQEYAEIAWDYFKQFSRDKETLEIIYNPYAD